VSYGTGGVINQTAQESAATTDHNLTLTGLVPGNSYLYFISGTDATGAILNAPVGSFATQELETDFGPGDVDNNGQVTISDAVLTLQNAVGLIPLSPQAMNAADVIKDGKVDVRDVTRILRVAMGVATLP
jgi:hypothetical protein